MGHEQTGLTPAFLSQSDIYRMSFIVQFVSSRFGFFWDDFCYLCQRCIRGIGAGYYGCEFRQPIFSIIFNYYAFPNDSYQNLLEMKGPILTEIIAQLLTRKSLQLQPHPALSLASITKVSECSNCNILICVVEQLNKKSEQMCFQYNSLLNETHRLIDLSFQYFQEQHKQYEEQFQELEKIKLENQEKLKEIKAELEESNKTVMQYRNLLLQKSQYTVYLQDKQQRYSKQRIIASPNNQVQVLKRHKRQRSQVCNKLEANNLSLTYENQQIKGQNSKLLEHIGELKEYIVRMEEDMAHANIRSPRIINDFSQIPDQSNFVNRPFNCNFNENEKCSIEQQSPIADNFSESDHLFIDNLSQQQSVRSSFAPKGKALRDVLNISGQTSNYFNFRTKQKFLQSNPDIIKNYSNQNDLNFINTTNQVGQKDCKKNILQIKQFEVNESIARQVVQIPKQLQNVRQQQITEKNKQKQKQKQKRSAPLNMGIDPYYAFFSLTIQCLKLNWPDMNQVANIQLLDQWDSLIQSQVPINKWSEHLHKLLVQKIEQKD